MTNYVSSSVFVKKNTNAVSSIIFVCRVNRDHGDNHADWHHLYIFHNTQVCQILIDQIQHIV